MTLIILSEVKCINCGEKFKAGVPTRSIIINSKKNQIYGIYLCKICREFSTLNLPKILKHFGYKIIKCKK